MNKLTDAQIAEAAYYIWKNNGCKADSHASDWAAAVYQLSANKPAARKTAASSAAASKISAADISALNQFAVAAKGKKVSPVSAASKLMAVNLASATNAALKKTNKTPLRKI